MSMIKFLPSRNSPFAERWTSIVEMKSLSLRTWGWPHTGSAQLKRDNSQKLTRWRKEEKATQTHGRASPKGKKKKVWNRMAYIGGALNNLGWQLQGMLSYLQEKGWCQIKSEGKERAHRQGLRICGWIFGPYPLVTGIHWGDSSQEMTQHFSCSSPARGDTIF